MADRHPREDVAERNLASILDGAERLIEGGKGASVAAVAREAGVSRVTVYAHFSDRERLVAAVLERALGRTTTALASADPESGPAPEALARLIAASWEQLDRNEAIARAAFADLPPKEIRRALEAPRAVYGDLLEKGRREGAFRKDLPTEWLVSAVSALVHAAAAEVRAGGLERTQALDAATASIVDLWAGPSPSRSALAVA